MLNFKRPPSRVDAPLALVRHEPSSGAFQAAIPSMARHASTIGRESAEVRGALEDTTRASARSADTVESLASQVTKINDAQTSIGRVSRAGLESVGRVRSAVENVGQGVGDVVATLRDVARAAESITQIALQTRLVAFNASVEAKRAGEAGRGFGVVADAVKDLAGKVEQSSKDIMRTVGLLDTRIDVLAREIRFDEDAGARQGEFQSALVDVRSAVSSIIAAADQSREICDGLDQRMAAIVAEMSQTGRVLGGAMARSDTLLGVAEALIDGFAGSGVKTEDTPYIEAAIAAARRVGQTFDEALNRGEISAVDLFDERYLPIAGSNPAQFTTRFNALADKVLPAIQEPLLALSPKVQFCITADRNGYISTHIRKHNVPQRGVLAWDTANSRYRRMFNDRTGLAAGRNERPFLLQTYRRDLGNGEHLVMKEVDAPVTVAGRHWGGLRLAFRF